MDYLEQARELFKADIYATETTGIVIEEVAVGYAKCSLSLNKSHMNAANCVMGGAIFTLADFAFAVAANAGAPLTVSVTSQISYISATKGDKLTAKANCIKAGRSTCFYEIEIKDDLDRLIAKVSTTGFIRAGSTCIPSAL